MLNPQGSRDGRGTLRYKIKRFDLRYLIPGD